MAVSPAGASDGRNHACGHVQDHDWCAVGDTLVPTCPKGFMLIGDLAVDGTDANGDGWLCTSRHRGAIDDTLTSAAP